MGRECVQTTLPEPHTRAAHFLVSSRTRRRHRARARCRPTQSEGRRHGARLDAYHGLRRRRRSPHYRRGSACLLRSEFPATHSDQSGAKLHLVHNTTTQTIEQFQLTDERTHESSQLRTGNWLRGRLLSSDLGFYSLRRFALIDENSGFSTIRLKSNANPLILGTRGKWHGRAISLPGRRLQEVIDDLTREIIDVIVEVSFKRRASLGSNQPVWRSFASSVSSLRTPTTTICT